MPKDEGTMVATGLRSGFLFRRMTIAASLLALVIGSAYVSVPLPVGPVPMTMQSLAVLLVGIWGGARTGAGVCATYVALGLMGFPVFAGGVSAPGLAFLALPTGGFLLAFIGASFIAGKIAASASNRWIGVAMAMFVGHVVIFAGGLAWLSVFIGMEKAILVGLVPFLAGSALKICLGTALVAAMPWKKRAI